MKIILLAIILTFFLPFFIVSCGSQEVSFSISGFEAAFGKRGGNYAFQEGNPLMLILIAAPVILLVLGLFMRNKKSSLFEKIIYIIVPVFNICASVTVRVAAQVLLEREIAKHTLGLMNFGLASLIKLRSGSGFILYIILNGALLALACVNIFMIKKQAETESGDGGESL